MRFDRLSLRHEGVLGIGRQVVSLFRRSITFCKECKLCSRWHLLRYRWNDQWSWKTKDETKLSYFVASFASGQDESNPALWLATRAGKMELSCPLGTTCRVPQEKFSQKPCNKSFIDQACSFKMAGYWPRSLFLRVYGPRLRLGP